MTLPYVLQHTIPAALSHATISGAVKRLSRLTAPRHTTPLGAAQVMVNRKSISHGLAARGNMHPLYLLLNGMKARCNYPSATHYRYYGGRGISVCDEWIQDPQSFVAWAMENGWKAGLEIDRKNTDGDYAPDNCRFITHRENSQRTSRIRTTPDQVVRVRELLSSGESVKVAARSAGVSYMVAWHIKNSPDVWSNVK